MTGTPRVLFHVQHLLGIGHLRRASLVAGALADAGVAVTVAQGGMPDDLFDFGAARVVQLPPLRSADAGFGGLVDADGRPLDEAGEAARRDALLALYDQVRPNLVLLESFPFGRRQMRFELMPLLARIAESSPRPKVAVSIRDILQRRKAAREQETVLIVRDFVDQVLIHGDPTLAQLADSFGAAAEIADKLFYTGYVAPPPPQERLRDRVVISAGGGAVGDRLLTTALTARPHTGLRDCPWTILAGPNLPDRSLAALRAGGSDAVTILRSVPDLPALLAQAVVSVSQGGYNTLMDIAVSATPAVVVPFAGEDETEQPMRAERLSAHGAITVVSEADLSPVSLARAVDRARAAPNRWPALDLEGARATARRLLDLVRNGESARP